MEEKKTTFKEKFEKFWSVKRNRIASIIGCAIILIAIILAIVLPLTLGNKDNKGNESSSSQIPGDETSSSQTGGNGSSSNAISAAEWNAAFDKIEGNYTFKYYKAGKIYDIVEMTKDGYRVQTWEDASSDTATEDTYYQIVAESNIVNVYTLNVESGDYDREKLVEGNEDYEWYKTGFAIDNFVTLKEYCSFIDHYDDFHYDADKGGYFAESATSSLVEYEETGFGEHTMIDVLVTFAGDKISGVSADYIDPETNQKDRYVVEKIGSTELTYPNTMA